MIKEFVLVASISGSPSVFLRTGCDSPQVIFVCDKEVKACAPTDSAQLTANLFGDLSRQWKAETKYFSDFESICQNPHYRAIVAMGKRVVPLMLRELASDDPEHWFAALQEITGSDPVLPEDRGQIGRMAAAWIAWGKESGYTS